PAAEAALYRQHDLEVIARGQPVQFEERATRPDGSIVTSLVDKFLLLDDAGRPYALCGIATDITDRKAGEEQKLQLERRLLESQKLESLGVLAGGIAHDFNNILTAILGNASLVNLELPADHLVRPQLRQIEQAARRASDLCAQMLAYAGKTAFITTPVSLSTLVRETTALLEVTVGRRARLELQVTPDLPAVLGDATQLRQIVMNLVINAADAIGERTGGIIVIQTSVHDLTAEYLAGAVQSPSLAAGRYVGLQVSDNGSGMNPEVLARIFEPFFTTKFSGRGLGLAAAVGIVQSHHGALFVESTPGQGTT
ncbi:MAG: ATP-binding protein, partial [Oleiharenicola lentus]